MSSSIMAAILYKYSKQGDEWMMMKYTTTYSYDGDNSWREKDSRRDPKAFEYFCLILFSFDYENKFIPRI